MLNGSRERAQIAGWAMSLTPTINAMSSDSDIADSRERTIQTHFRRELRDILVELQLRIKTCSSFQDTIEPLKYAITRAKLKYLEAERLLEEMNNQ
jgi:hypothetical protein